MSRPQDTPELFERYLPYAIALGVENRWADRFAGVLAAAAAQGQQGFAWYSGSQQPVERSRRLRQRRRLVARQHDQLGLDRAGLEQRFRRRRVVGRRRRRRRRRRLVSRSGRAPAARSSGLVAIGAVGLTLEAELLRKLHRRLVPGAMMRPDRLSARDCCRTSQHRLAGFARHSPGHALASEDPAHLGLPADRGSAFAPGSRTGRHGRSAGRRSCARPPTCRCRCSDHNAGAGQHPAPGILARSWARRRNDDAPRAAA